MRRLIPLFILACLPQLALAQGDKVSLRALALTSGEFPDLWALNAATPVKIGFSPVQPSETIRVNRANPWPVYQGALNEQGNPVDASPAKLRLPEAPGILLLGWMLDGKVRLVPVPDSNPAGKFDDWFLINASSKSIAVQVGATNKPVVFKSAAHEVFKINVKAGEGAAIVMASQEGATWTKFFSTYWPVHADKRCLIVVTESEDRIEAKQIFEELKREVRKDDP